MLKRLFLVLATVLVASCFSCSNLPVAHNPELTNLIEQEMDATVMLLAHPRSYDENDILVEDTSKWRVFCSGTWISDRLILSAAHCAKDHGEIAESVMIGYKADVRARPGREAYAQEAHEARVVKIDVDDDLVLLEVDKVHHAHHVAEISTGKISVGDKVEMIGHPLGNLYTALPGDVVASRWLEVRGSMGLWLQINGNSYFGSSGGGAFDGNGKLIGVCSFIMRGPGMTFWAHRDIILSFLDKR